jgi:MFS superfamily sulfate permease-like transporter
VDVVGNIETAVPLPGLPQIGLFDLPFLLAGAGGIVFLAVGESVGAARTFAARHRYEIDPDQELIGLGAANVSSAMFGGFTVDASLSASATGEAAGTRSQLSSLVTSALMLATAMLLAPLFENLPVTILAAVVIAASLGLMNVAEIQRYLATRRTDAILAIVALVGVVTTTVLIGLVIATLLSLVLLLYRASRPNVTVLGRLGGRAGTYVALERHEEAQAIPGLLILRVDGPLYFFNASAARQAVLAAVDATEPAPGAVLLDVGASPDFDVTTLDLLQSLVRELHERSIDVLLAQVRSAARERMRRSGMMAEVGEERVVFSVEAGVEAHLAGAGQPVASRTAASSTEAEVVTSGGVPA